MSKSVSEMMLDLVQKTMDSAGFHFNLREEDLLYGVPGAGENGKNTSVGIEILNQPVKPRSLLLHYNRLELDTLTVGLAAQMRVDSLPATVYEALPYLAQYLHVRLTESDVEDAEIPRTTNTAVIPLIAKSGSLGVIGAVEVQIIEQGIRAWTTSTP